MITSMENDTSMNSSRSTLKFNLFFSLEIASTVCTLYLFCRFFTDHHFRRSLNNQTTFLLLFISFLTVGIPLSFTTYFLASGSSPFRTDTFCSIWNWLMYSLCLTNLCLMTFTCCERHLLIFHSRLYQLEGRRRWLHYLPLVICLLYPVLFYTFAVFFTSCSNTSGDSSLFCLWPCDYNDDYWLGYYDLIANNCLTNFLIPILSFSLLVRVMKQKHQMKQQIFKWRRDRKILLQILSVSVIYSVFWLPDNIISLVEMRQPTFLLDLEVNVFLLGPLFSNVLYPFACLLSYPELLYKKRRIVNRIVPR